MARYRSAALLGALALLVALLGYATVSRGPLGFFADRDVEKTLAATVTSLKAENRLVVYQYSGDTRVSVQRERFLGLLHGTQELFVPATVTYYLDMGELGAAQVRYDAAAKLVRVELPTLRIGDVAFQPERATAINGGVLTFDDAVVQELQRANYATARQAFVKQAQSKVLMDLARAQAIRNIQNYFEIPLRAMGDDSVQVRAAFRP